MLRAMEHFEHDGLHFDVVTAGPPDGTPVVLLHGFPESPRSWDRVMPALADAGHCVLVPAQRGYSPGARPSGRRQYRMELLVADVLALADAAGADTFHLVGHDWGGGVAWAVAGAAPERLRSVTSVSTPHPRALLWSLPRSRQALLSWYMLFFQLPRVPEAGMLAAGGKRFVRTLVDSGLPEEYANAYAEQMSQPGALTAALNWYRAIPFSRAMRDDTQVRVPTLYVWSTDDMALGRAAADRTAAYVSADYRFEVLPGVSHWIPEQVPELLAPLLLEHISRHDG